MQRTQSVVEEKVPFGDGVKRSIDQKRKRFVGDWKMSEGDEKNLVVSFIQFIRQKVSANQCTDDQVEGLEGALFKPTFDSNDLYDFFFALLLFRFITWL